MLANCEIYALAKGNKFTLNGSTMDESYFACVKWNIRNCSLLSGYEAENKKETVKIGSKKIAQRSNIRAGAQNWLNIKWLMPYFIFSIVFLCST